MSILRHVRNAEFFSLTRIGLGDVATFETDRAGSVRTGNQSRQRFDQFSLAVALDTRNANDLTLANLERDAIDTFRSVASRNRQIANADYGVAGFGAQDNVLSHGHRLNQHEVLMYHPDAQRNRIMRCANLTHLVID